MSSSGEIIAVAGASGRTGMQVVQELVRRGYRVRALVRDAARAAGMFPDGVDVVAADIAVVASLEQALGNADACISALGSRKPMSRRENERVDHQGTCNLATAAASCGLRQLVVISSVGAGNSRQALKPILRLLMGPVLRAKERAEAFLCAGDLCYTIIRPGGLVAKARSGKVAFGEGGQLSGMISRDQVAAVAVDALEKPAMRNRVLEVVDAATVKADRRHSIIDL